MPQYNSRMHAKGLKNYGNTCYISASLQCLLNIPSINNALLNTTNRFRDPVAQESVNFFKANSEDQEWALENLVRMIWKTKRINFARGQQHDSSEFLVYILNLITEIFEDEPYRLRMRRQAVCGTDQGHFWSQSIEEDRVINVTLPQTAIGYFGKNSVGPNLIDALNTTFDETELNANCEECGYDTVVYQYRHVVNRPSVLILSLKIFEPVCLLVFLFIYYFKFFFNSDFFANF